MTMWARASRSCGNHDTVRAKPALSEAEGMPPRQPAGLP